MNRPGRPAGSPLQWARQAAPLLLVMLLASPAFSATINVTANATDTLNGADAQCSLREAITNVNNAATTYADCAPTGAYGTNDTINIPAGTYTTTIAGAGEDLNATGDYDIRRSVTIVGAGSGSTTVNGGGLDRVFHIIGAYTVTISGVTITGGNAAITNGGGIFNWSGTLTVTNSTITGNTAGWGGGISHFGTLTVTNSTITSNSASFGAGISNFGTITVTNSTISSNTGSGSGGIYNFGTITVTNSTISGNTAGSGGGIYNLGGTATVTNSTISANTASGSGGGIYKEDGTVTVTNSTISANTADRGGGIYNNWGGTTTVTNSTISGNTADWGGGGIYNSGSTATVTVTNSTIVRNIAPAGQGGGIFNNTGTATFTNSIVADNGVGTDCVGVITNSGGNIDKDSTCAGFTHTATMVQGTGFSALASNGGPTQTHALLAGSAAIDTAPTCAGLTTDQRGAARPQGSACDIGAYEVGATDYAITASVIGVGGTVTPPSQRVVGGTTASFTVTANTGYTIGAVTGCGGSLAGTTYTTGAITGACAVSATFTINSYAVTATAGSGGSVTPANQNVNYGSTAAITVTPDTGYTASASGCGGALVGNTYTTGVITGACAVSATFTAVSIGSLTVTLSPAEAVTAGAQWRVDGGAWQTSGATVAGVSAGRHTVSFDTATGYTSPANQAVTVTLGQTATASGTYTTVNGTGSLKVDISPASAVTAGAQWRVDGGTWQTDGATVAGVSAGSHTLSFGAVAGYTTPADKVVNITNGRTATSAGAYKQNGSLIVTILPAGVTLNGAQWSVDGGTTWNNSGAEVTGLAVGNYTVSFKTGVTGYSPPPNKTVLVTSGTATRTTGAYTTGYTVLGKASTGGSVTPAKKTVADTATSVSFTVTARTGYTTSATVGGACPAGTWETATTYTIASVTGACTATFTFTKAPTVTPGAATNIMQAGATLNAKVNPENASTTVTFEYGADTNYGTTVSAGVLSGGVAVPLTGGTAQAVAAPVTGLTCNRTYHFRVVAVNSVNTTTGADRTFKTSACLAPTAATVGAVNVTATGATLKGAVNPNKAATTVTFEYVANAGTSAPSAYGSTVSYGTLTGGVSKLVSSVVTGLTCGTKYHFRATASNANPPTKYGIDKTFTTSACAAPDNGAATDSNTAITISPVSDFDGDGKSDILFRDVVTGQTQAWMMDGMAVTSNLVTSLNAGAYTSSAGWQAQGIGDFDGDGKYDLLWRDAESGLLAVWTMNGVTVVTSAMTSLNPGAYTAVSGWQVHGVGDFDGDAKSDILWRDAATGQTAIWFMSGASVTSSSNTNVNAGPYTFTAGWQVHGVGDFNGDGKSDILWRQIGTGKTSIWFMNGAYKSGGGYTNVQAGAYTSTTGWQVEGVGDFNGDKKADILWRNADSGVTVVWFMNGAMRASGAYTSVQPGPYTPTSGWQIHGVGDFNGDWKSDVLLRYAGTGQTYIWLMNGAVVTGDLTSIHAGSYDSSVGLRILSEEMMR